MPEEEKMYVQNGEQQGGSNVPEKDTEEVAENFVDVKEDEINDVKASLQKLQNKSKDLGGEVRSQIGLDTDLDPLETERYINDAFIKEQLDKIRRMEDAIKVLKGRQNILDENGEVSAKKFGDIVLGYTIQFPDEDGSVIKETLNIMLVPSALVGDGEFQTEINGEKIRFTVVSPNSEIGKRIVKASI